jgi:signal transduction histidine kinase/CheY-like chemotaxis protein
LLAHLSGRGKGSVTLAAIAWPPPAIAIAFIWARPLYEWPLYLLAILAAAFQANHVEWLSWQTQWAFALLNVVEVGLCAWVGRRYVAVDGNLATVKQLMQFVLLLPLGAVAVIASVGATIAAVPLDELWSREWRTLLVGNGVAILVLVPALLSWIAPRRSGWARFSLRSNAATFAGGGCAIALLLVGSAFGAPVELLRVLFSLVLVSVAVYGGMKSASLALCVFAVLAVALALTRVGPYGHGDAMSIGLLQLDIAGFAILSFFVAVAVNERRMFAVQLEQARRFESLGLLASGIAHDFNNILGAASGYAEMAQERLRADSPARKPLAEVRSAIRRGRDLTDQILLAACRGGRRRDVIDLRDVAREAAALSQPLCPDGVAIELQLPPKPLWVYANNCELSRAALNLVRNASQAARSGVVVRVGSGGPRDVMLTVGRAPSALPVWIEVRDDGAGIALEHIDQLFEPFVSMRKRTGETGTGLGLAIVAGVAIEHEGGVSVRTDATGTKFRFVLPLTERRAAPPTPTVAVGHGEAVLLVDDDDALRARAEDWLAELGFEPVSFDDPADALLAIKASPNQFTLLLTDIDMPVMRGDELAQAVREWAPRLPVVFWSGNPTLDDLARASGALALPKPFERADLARVTADAMSGKS